MEVGSQQFGTDPTREELVTPGTKTSYEIPGLEGILHTVRVIAFNRNSEDTADQDGAPSAIATGTPKPAQGGERRRWTAHDDPQKLSRSRGRQSRGLLATRVQWKSGDGDDDVRRRLNPDVKPQRNRSESLRFRRLGIGPWRAFRLHRAGDRHDHLRRCRGPAVRRFLRSQATGHAEAGPGQLRWIWRRDNRHGTEELTVKLGSEVTGATDGYTGAVEGWQNDLD